MRFKKTIYSLLVASMGCISSLPPAANTPPAMQTAQRQTNEALERNVLAHGNELRKIGLESISDTFEHGGVGYLDGILSIVELNNDVKQNEERYRTFALGDSAQLSQLINYAYIAARVQGVCCPESEQAFTGRAAHLAGELTLFSCLPDEAKKVQEKSLWSEYDSLVNHNMYIKDPAAYGKLDPKKILFHFHTHQDGQPPSLQDIDLSKERTEVVVSVTSAGGYQLYLADKGFVKLIYTNSPAEITMR